jgi:hypothetical protein
MDELRHSPCPPPQKDWRQWEEKWFRKMCESNWKEKDNKCSKMKWRKLVNVQLRTEPLGNHKMENASQEL